MTNARGSCNGTNSLLLRERRHEDFWTYGEVPIMAGFTKASMQQLIDESKLWVREGNKRAYKYIISGVSCLESSIWMNGYPDSGISKTAILCHDYIETSERDATFKKKIGLEDCKTEIRKTLEWLSKLPASVKIRLDANGALSHDSLMRWVDALWGNAQLDFIEQPMMGLPSEELMSFMQQSNFPIALDESVVEMGSPQELLEHGWSGYFILKPCLLACWESTLGFIKKNPDKTVVSTVFESPFGYEAVLRLCRHSNLVPGVDRSVYKGLPHEIKRHHSFPLALSGVFSSDLDSLWSEI